ncbi:MAG: hypothetical protein NZ518_02175 [Dehalococcoidia bacterium]|nr:hypothetical protein [Dehalococcoidia bacterium]
MKSGVPTTWVIAWFVFLAVGLLSAWDRLAPEPPRIHPYPWTMQAVALFAMLVPLLDSLYWLRRRRERTRMRPILIDAGQSLRMALASALPLALYVGGALSDVQLAALVAATLLPEAIYVLPPAIVHGMMGKPGLIVAARRTQRITQTGR